MTAVDRVKRLLRALEMILSLQEPLSSGQVYCLYAAEQTLDGLYPSFPPHATLNALSLRMERSMRTHHLGPVTTLQQVQEMLRGEQWERGR